MFPLQCTEKPKDDPYGFTHFAHSLNACDGGINPLPSDSRRRPDRALLEQGNSSGRRAACRFGSVLVEAAKGCRCGQGSGGRGGWMRDTRGGLPAHPRRPPS